MRDEPQARSSRSRPRRGAKRSVLGVITSLPAYLRLLLGLMSDATVSRVDKLMVMVSLAYIVTPLDFVPDVIPFFGQVDDVFLLVVAIQRLVKRAGRSTVLRYWSGDPRDLSDAALAKMVGAAAFFLPGRTRRRLKGVLNRR